MLQMTVRVPGEPAIRNGVMTAAVLAAMGISQAGAQTAAVPTALPEVSVTGTREKELLRETPASVGVIREQSIREVRPTHPSQIISQVPGAAVSITNGEGHQTSIRQPFTTGPVYLFLEDGIPIRATRFSITTRSTKSTFPAPAALKSSADPAPRSTGRTPSAASSTC